MADEHAKADALRRMAVLFQGIVEAADDYDKIGSIKDHIKSLEAQRDAHVHDCCSAQKSLDETRVLMQQTNDQIARSIGDANAHARRIIEDAQNEVTSMIAEAEQRGLQMQNEREHKDAERIEKAKAEAEAHEEAVKKLIAEEGKLEAGILVLRGEYAERKAALDAVEAQLSKLGDIIKR